MNLKERIAEVRRTLDALATKLVATTRPGHVAYISKRDAGHIIARLIGDLDSIEAEIPKRGD